MLSEKTIQIVKEITPAIVENGETITRHFYQLMFAEDPEVKPFFNPANQHSGKQPQALAGAILAYFGHIDDLQAIAPAVELIAQKHCSLCISADQYPIVGKHLLAAIQFVMGDAATDDVMAAVAEAYGVLADILIERESSIYAELRSKPGGWNGVRQFVVDQKVVECDIVTSFYLRPHDDQPLMDFLPGQYITVHADGLSAPNSPRNYSLSDRPGTGYYRISVKREPGPHEGDPAGVISNHLHDHVHSGDSLNLGPPCGEFTLDPATASDRRKVFLAGGIGVTPLLSMAKALHHAKSPSPIFFLQAAKHSRVHAMGKEVRQLQQGGLDVHTYVLFDDPLDDDLSENRCDGFGRFSVELLREWTGLTDAELCDSEYYLCGPALFMEHGLNDLQGLGVSPNQMHYEFFGPKQALAV